MGNFENVQSHKQLIDCSSKSIAAKVLVFFYHATMNYNASILHHYGLSVIILVI